MSTMFVVWRVDIMRITNAKKGDLSLTTVVIAALALLVLVVLTIVFSGRMGMFSSGMRHCDTVCALSSAECTELGYNVPAYYGGCKDTVGNEFRDLAYCCRGSAP